MYRRRHPTRRRCRPSQLIHRHFHPRRRSLVNRRRNRSQSHHFRPRCRWPGNRWRMASRFESHRSLVNRYRLVVIRFPIANHFENRRCLANRYRLVAIRSPMVNHSGNQCCPASHCRLAAIRFPMVSHFESLRCFANRYRWVVSHFGIVNHSGSPMASRTNRCRPTMSRWPTSHWTTNCQTISCRTTSRWTRNRRTMTSRTSPTRLPTKTICSIRSRSLFPTWIRTANKPLVRLELCSCTIRESQPAEPLANAGQADDHLYNPFRIGFFDPHVNLVALDDCTDQDGNVRRTSAYLHAAGLANLQEPRVDRHIGIGPRELDDHDVIKTDLGRFGDEQGRVSGGRPTGRDDRSRFVRPAAAGTATALRAARL